MRETRKAYLEKLNDWRVGFLKQHNIHISEKFDPMRWLRSYDVRNIVLRWPHNKKEIDKMVYQYYKGECGTLDFWFVIQSTSEHGKSYDFTIKLAKQEK